LDHGADNAKTSKDRWDILFGFTGFLTVIATVIVAGIAYRQSVLVQTLLTRSAESISSEQLRSALEAQRQKYEQDLVLQSQGNKSTLTIAQVNSEVSRQIARLTDERERSLNLRDNQLKRYMSDENFKLGRDTKRDEVQSRFVELSLDILKASPSADNQGLRQWATTVVDTYSGVKLSPQARKELREAPLLEPTEPRADNDSAWSIKYEPAPNVEQNLDSYYFTKIRFDPTDHKILILTVDTRRMAQRYYLLGGQFSVSFYDNNNKLIGSKNYGSNSYFGAGTLYTRKLHNPYIDAKKLKAEDDFSLADD